MIIEEKESIYPATNSRKFVLAVARHVVAIVFIAAIIVCGIVNICIGGEPWVFYVVGAEVVFWTLFMRWPLVETSFMTKLFEAVAVVIGYLYLINGLSKGHWVQDVTPIVLFSMIIVLSILFIADKKRKERNIIPIIILILGAIVMFMFAVFLAEISWQIIVLGAVALLSIGALISFFFKPLTEEFKKRFHT